jgi:hypothetical protein
MRGEIVRGQITLVHGEAAMAAKKRARTSVKTKRTLDARPDTIDFRDKMYVPTLAEVPMRLPLESYLACYRGDKVPVLDQGEEGACTGFGLAAVANHLLRCRKVVSDSTLVSPRMLYEMAKRYDEWAGERYEGSSARGAMKGWYRHGVCAAAVWPFDPKDVHGVLDHPRSLEAADRPLGAYYRVDHSDIRALHSALAEVGVLYATGNVHAGWDEVDAKTGLIPMRKRIEGGHAFAVVGYDERGFWIQNSWGPKWGKQGFGLISYDDWVANATDTWVARLGAPTHFAVDSQRPAQSAIGGKRASYAFTDLRPHVISLGNDGLLRNSGEFASTRESVEQIVANDIPRITKNWRVKRVLLYAHGGLVSEQSALQRVEDYRKQMLDAQVFPISFVWHSDFWSTLSNVLKEGLARRRPEGFLDDAKDFMLDRLDDTLEPLARLAGKPLWDEMKENARLASTHVNAAGQHDGGARLLVDRLHALHGGSGKLEVHIAGHSAGSVFMAYAIQRLRALGQPIASVSMWGAACTTKLFKEEYLPAIKAKQIARFALFTLKDAAEQDDDCVNIYNKSLLYLVSNALEDKSGLFFADGEPILGMEKFLFADPVFKLNRKDVLKKNPARVALCGLKNAEWVRSPNGLPAGGPDASHARHHGDFDGDAATVRATLARILDKADAPAGFDFRCSPSAARARRAKLNTASPLPGGRVV